MEDTLTWAILCRPDVFDRCRNRNGFSELVCLARCINTLNFLYSAVSRLAGAEPHHVRDRMNFYLFNAGVLYEGLGLVRRMNKAFKDDMVFQETMRPLLKDKTAQKIETLHLKNVRTNAVFHFLPDAFTGVMRDLPSETCVFLKANGTVNKDVHFEFADRMAVRIMVGDTQGEDFKARLDNVLVEIQNFNGLFVTQATAFLAKTLLQWGFDREEAQHK